jgi:CRISPR/Cas system-associated exonuclease Cas4 (RecB family)
MWIGMGRFTITWVDVYDYLRCPKIPAFKAIGLKLRRLESRKRPAIKPYTVGRLGERLTAALVPQLTESRRAADLEKVAEGPPFKVFRQAQETLRFLKREVERVSGEVLGRPLKYSRDEVRELVMEDVAGLVKVASKLSREFGSLQMVGEGVVKSSALPSEGNVDLVFSIKKGKFLMAEVKNTASISSIGKFQPSFYNSISRVGALVIGKRVRGDKPEYLPLVRPSENVATVLINPRLGVLQKVDKVIPLENILQGIWESKELGMLKRQPEVPKRDYCNRCPWKKYCSNWGRRGPPETRLDEIAKPPYLIVAKGLVECGFDLDTFSLYHELQDIIWEIEHQIWSQTERPLKRLYDLVETEHDSAVQIKKTIARLEKKIRNDIVEILATELDVSKHRALKLIGYRERASRLYSEISGEDFYYIAPEIRPYEDDIRRAVKNMSSELGHWKRILPSKEFREIETVQFAYTSIRMCGFPDKSRKLIRKAWQLWELS